MAIPAVWIAGVALELLSDVPAFVFPERDRLQMVSLPVDLALFYLGERLHLDCIWIGQMYNTVYCRPGRYAEPRRQTEVDTERKTDGW